MQQPDNPNRRKLLKTAAAVSAAAALTACGQGGQSAQTASSPEGKAAADCSGNGSHSQTSYDCYGVHQAGITTPHQTFGILCAFDVTVSDISQLINYFRTLTARIEFLTKGGELVDGDEKLPPAGSGLLGKTVPPDGLTVTVSVGASLFDARFGLGGKKPKHLQEMKDFPNDKLQKEWCDGDIGIQICAFSPETCQNALRDIIKNTAKYAITRWSLKNGSYQAIRIIRHFVEFWDRTPLQEQQAIFGREKYSGAPLGMKKEGDIPDYAKDPEGKAVPTDSHIRLGNPRDPEFMKKHLLFRRPFNYSMGLAKSGQLDVGLILVMYQANLADGFIFVQNLLNLEPLEEYISPFGGGYFFTLPGVEKGGFLGQSLLLDK